MAISWWVRRGVLVLALFGAAGCTSDAPPPDLDWAQNSTTKHWLHYGDKVQSYFHTRDAQGVLWEFVEVLGSGAPVLTPESDGAGAGGGCSANNPGACKPCKNGGTCGWIKEVFLN